MEESILITIKKMLGLEASYTAFDLDIILSINTAIVVMSQLCPGIKELAITGEDETWEELLNNVSQLEMAKSYLHLKVAKLFDPPNSGVLAEARNNMISELEWRLSVSDTFNKE